MPASVQVYLWWSVLVILSVMGILVGPQVFLVINYTGRGEVFIPYKFILYLCRLTYGH